VAAYKRHMDRLRDHLIHHRHDPDTLALEVNCRATSLALSAHILTDALAVLDDQRPSTGVEGRIDHYQDASLNRVMSPFSPIAYRRSATGIAPIPPLFRRIRRRDCSQDIGRR